MAASWQKAWMYDVKILKKINFTKKDFLKFCWNNCAGRGGEWGSERGRVGGGRGGGG